MSATVDDSGKNLEENVISTMPLPPMEYVALCEGSGPLPTPPLPPLGSYVSFGITINPDDPVVLPLEAQGRKRVYPQTPDHRKELKKLNFSILAAFLDLLKILIINPESPKRQEKLGDIEELFIQMHHLINEYRPHQARETLRVMLDHQRKERRKVTAALTAQISKASSSLNSICLSSNSDSL